jgi:hypothetical protein
MCIVVFVVTAYDALLQWQATVSGKLELQDCILLGEGVMFVRLRICLSSTGSAAVEVMLPCHPTVHSGMCHHDTLSQR